MLDELIAHAKKTQALPLKRTDTAEVRPVTRVNTGLNTWGFAIPNRETPHFNWGFGKLSIATDEFAWYDVQNHYHPIFFADQA